MYHARRVRFRVSTRATANSVFVGMVRKKYGDTAVGGESRFLHNFTG
jgi:hypothetical protein